MSVDAKQMVRALKRMGEAAGYLELGMAEHALGRLEGLDALEPLEADVAFLRGEALRIQHRYDDAAVSLKIAARKSPAARAKLAWLALSQCYHGAGDTPRAIQSLALARGAGRGPKRRKPR